MLASTAPMRTAALLALLLAAEGRNNLALTPPMGFMTWQLFRCNGPGAAGPDDDCTDPETTYCISSALIRGQAQAMHARGFAAAGYTTLSIDDCYMSGRNATTQELIAWPQAFPGGTLAPTADFVHGLGLRLGAYTAESRSTCCGHEGSEGFEGIDAATYAKWGVDYLLVSRGARRAFARSPPSHLSIFYNPCFAARPTGAQATRLTTRWGIPY